MKRIGKTFGYKFEKDLIWVYECEKCGWRTVMQPDRCTNPKCPEDSISRRKI